MPDYKELYLTLFDATEKAIRELIAAQQKCEELCLRTPLQEPVLLPFPQEPEEKQPKAYNHNPTLNVGFAERPYKGHYSSST